jgi:hypothetical protein
VKLVVDAGLSSFLMIVLSENSIFIVDDGVVGV